MKKNILVFPCGSEIGLDIYHLVKYSTHFHLVGASSVDDHGKFLYEDYIPDVPFINDDSFLPYLRTIIKEHQIDAIYPTMDAVITVLKENESYIGCKVIASPLETTRLCLSKKNTYNTLKDIVPTPTIFHSPGSVDSYPVFVKPDIGYGSRGTKIVYNKDALDNCLKEQDGLLILEYLPGEEYTVDCFTDSKGDLLFCGARIRARIKSGISVNTTIVKNQEPFYELARKINNRISFRGAWFYQVKRRKDGTLCLMEIASRLGGSSLLFKAKGVNFALLSLFDAFGYEVSILSNDYSVELDRALGSRYKVDLVFDSVYCDYDDCLILEKTKVNTELVSFLYQCFNQGKQLFLLTRHIGDLAAELKFFRLEQLFDRIIQLSIDEDKAAFITTSNPIFIDDSFAERMNIKKKLNIPVFEPAMIDIFIK